jgi:hypothetical protein
MGGVDGLITLRVLFVTFVGAVLMIGVVVVVLNRFGDDVAHFEPIPVAGLVVAVGVLVQVIAAVVERPLDASGPVALASSYRTRFFLRVASAEGAALLGFAGFILTTVPAVYLVGLVVTLVGFTRAAPTRARLAADQERLSPAGNMIGLVAALRGSNLPPPVSSPGPR